MTEKMSIPRRVRIWVGIGGAILALAVVGYLVVWMNPTVREWIGGRKATESPARQEMNFSRSAQEYLPEEKDLPGGFRTVLEQKSVPLEGTTVAQSSAGIVFTNDQGESSSHAEPDRAVYFIFVFKDAAEASAGYRELSAPGTMEDLHAIIGEEGNEKFLPLALAYQTSVELSGFSRTAPGSLGAMGETSVLFRMNNLVGVVSVQQLKAEGSSSQPPPDSLLNFLSIVTRRLDKAANNIRRPCDCTNE
jgi:hypothetical protein